MWWGQGSAPSLNHRTTGSVLSLKQQRLGCYWRLGGCTSRRQALLADQEGPKVPGTPPDKYDSHPYRELFTERLEVIR